MLKLIGDNELCSHIDERNMTSVGHLICNFFYKFDFSLLIFKLNFDLVCEFELL